MLTLLLYLWFIGTGQLSFSTGLALGFAIFDLLVLGIIFDNE